MPKKGFFITGTDTEIGKTYTTVRLIQHLCSQGLKVSGLKPVASGCEETVQGLRNDDALQIQQASNVNLAYEHINRYAFKPAIAPHIAAKKANEVIDLNNILEDVTFAQVQSDTVVIEAAGGWLVPLNDSQTVADLACLLKLPVIIVVGIRLGCINHALLSFNEIKQSGVPIAGWVANKITDDEIYSQEQINEIKKRTDLACICEIDYCVNLTNLEWSI